MIGREYVVGSDNFGDYISSSHLHYLSLFEGVKERYSPDSPMVKEWEEFIDKILYNKR